MPTRGSAKAVKLRFAAPTAFQWLEANLSDKQMDEFFALMGSSHRLWMPMKMISVGHAKIELVNGQTQAVSLLTVPKHYDAFQINGRQWVVQPPGQIEHFLVSLSVSTNR